jgi:hypothetical protein
MQRHLIYTAAQQTPKKLGLEKHNQLIDIIGKECVLEVLRN